MMGPGEVLTALGEGTPLEEIALGWEQSMSGFPQGTPEFLRPEQITESRQWCGFGGAFDSALIETAQRILRQEPLCRLAWHCHWRLFGCPESQELRRWPSLQGALGESAGLFYLLAGLAVVPPVRAYHKSLGLSETITRDTCQQVRGFCEMYQRGHGGRLGLQLGRLSWLRHYPRSPLFRLGCLEFWLKENPCAPRTYRHRHSGETIALADPGEWFTSDGYIDNGEPKPPGSWQAFLREEQDFVTGFPISPYGTAMHQEITLPLEDWGCVLTPKDHVLQVHIPTAGPRLTPEATDRALKEAVSFFNRHFPGASPQAFATTSWMFSDCLERILPPTSNIVRFLRELYLFPIPSGPYSGLSFVFPEDTFDPSTASRQTSLQRAILEFLAAGNRWRIGGMFLLLEHLEQFGRQYYRSRWPPALIKSHLKESS